jgi:hypothetical protein
MMGKRITRKIVAALVFAIAGPLVLGAVGKTGPFILIPLVALAFWWMARHTGTDDDEDDAPAPKTTAAPVRRVPSGKRVTPPKPKGRRVTQTPNRTKARKR